MKHAIKSISVIGDGGWGTTLAIHLAKKGYDIVLWGAFADYVALTATARENKKFLPGYKIPHNVFLTADISVAIERGDLIVLACPSEYLIGTLIKIKNTDYPGKAFVSVIKGIDPLTFQRMSQVIHQHLGKIPLAVLSGPTIAAETAAGMATTAVVACSDNSLAKTIQNVFNSPGFRIYTNPDVIGVEISGSLKNVIAIACGICDGLGLGTNAKAAILTRGLVEMTHLAAVLGAKKETFYGLAGLGDLATTCFSPNSRNRTVGEALGKGKSITSVLGGMPMVAEGVVTAKAVYLLSRKKNISMPIVEQVYKIIFKHKNPRKAMADLMGRSLKSET